MVRLPEVIGIGVRRCASSWLHRCLNQHPSIGKPENGLHFFSQHFGLGLEWYLEELAPYTNRDLLVEFSVSYTYPEYYNFASELMARIAPHAKLFIAVRNPIERAFSDYLRSMMN